jgi:hypothetical protein
MDVLEKAWRRASAYAVLRPKTPDPMMRTDDGGEKAADVEEGEKEDDSRPGPSAILNETRYHYLTRVA